MNNSWIITAKGQDLIQEPFLISFPELTYEKPPHYVQLFVGTMNAVCITSTRRGAGGYQIWISSESELAKYDGTTISDLCPANWFQYDWYRLLHSPKHSVALFGLVISVIGLVLDGVIASGRQLASTSGTIGILLLILTILAEIFKFGGLVIVFVNQFWKR